MALLALLWGCDQPLTRNDLEAIKSKGELVLITRNNAACFYEGPTGPTGFEYELASAFAKHLGVTLRPLIIEEEADMITALKNGEGRHYRRRPSLWSAIRPLPLPGAWLSGSIPGSCGAPRRSGHPTARRPCRVHHLDSGQQFPSGGPEKPQGQIFRPAVADIVRLQH